MIYVVLGFILYSFIAGAAYYFFEREPLPAAFWPITIPAKLGYMITYKNSDQYQEDKLAHTKEKLRELDEELEGDVLGIEEVEEHSGSEKSVIGGIIGNPLWGLEDDKEKDTLYPPPANFDYRRAPKEIIEEAQREED